MEEIKHDCGEQCQQEDNPCKTVPQEPLKLWVLDYTNTDDSSYKGIAVVAAYDGAQAVSKFKADTMHNGYQNKIKIDQITEIPYPVEARIISETYIKVFE